MDQARGLVGNSFRKPAHAALHGSEHQPGLDPDGADIETIEEGHFRI